MEKIKTPTAAIYTLGCRVNQYESRAISEYLEDNGFEMKPFNTVCDVYIVNTCAVTAESERKSRQIVRRAYKRNPYAKILITGCQSQLNPKSAAELPGVCYVGGNGSKLEAAKAAVDLLGATSSQTLFGSKKIGTEYERYNVKKPDHTRAYLKIQDGCENKCSYCVIPRVRGPVRSKPFDDVISEAESLAKLGYKEIILTGIETCSYQHDLVKLMLELTKINGMERIRLSSVNPPFIDRGFTDAIKGNTKICPHFHLSLQSCCNKTLGDMKRKYNISTVIQNVSYMRENIKNVTFTADMICGFPGESEEDFSITKENFTKLNLLSTHIFPFSRRPGTIAATMPNQIEEEIKSARCRELSEIAVQSKKQQIQQFINNKETLNVLFEEQKKGYWLGHTENFIEVRAKSAEKLHNTIRPVKLISYENDTTDALIID